MGNEQTTGGSAPQSGANNANVGLLLRAKTKSPKLGRTGAIVVVRDAPDQSPLGNPATDEDTLKLQEIPQFYPIMRNALNMQTLRDPADIFSRLNARAIFSVMQRLREHLTAAADVVSSEQASISGRIRELDYAILTLFNCLSERRKTDERFAANVQTVRALEAQVRAVSSTMELLVPWAQRLNALLPDEDRLPPFDAAAAFTPTGVDEQRVVDSGRNNFA